MNKKERTEILGRIDKKIHQSLKDRFSTEAKLRQRNAKLQARAYRQRGKLFDKISRDLKIDLEPYLVAHARGFEARSRWVKKSQQKFRGAARRFESSRRRQVAVLERFRRKLDRARNPNSHVCLGFASGHSHEEQIWNSSGNRTTNVQFHDDGFGQNILELDLLATADIDMQRDDWVHFLWEEGPSQDITANIQAIVEPKGIVHMVLDDYSCWFDPIGCVGLDLWMTVSQGATEYPERTIALLPWTVIEGAEILYRQILSSTAVEYINSTPLVSGIPVVVTVGFRFQLIVGLSGDNSESIIDFGTGGREVNFPLVHINF